MEFKAVVFEIPLKIEFMLKFKTFRLNYKQEITALTARKDR